MLPKTGVIHMGIACKVMVLNDIMPHWIRVVPAKPMLPIIAVTTELSLSGSGSHGARVRMHPQIAASNPHGFTGHGRRHVTSAVPICQVQSMIQAIPQAIDAMLLVAFGEPTEQGFDRVCTPITVCILSHQKVGRGRNQNPISPYFHASGIRQIVCKNRRVIVLTVTIRILQHPDSPTGLTLAIYTQRIIAHFRDPKSPIGPPIESDRVRDEWFCRHQFNFKTQRYSNTL